MDSKQDELIIDVSVRLITDDPKITGFDSVKVLLNGNLLDKGGANFFSYGYKKDDGEINAEDKLGLGICGGKVSLTVEVYAFGRKSASETKTLDKSSNIGNCKSSSSAEQSSSSAFQIKPLVSAFNPVELKDGEGLNLSTGAKGGSDLTVSITTSGGRETELIAGSGYHMTDMFWWLDKDGNDTEGNRGYSYHQGSPDYVGGNFDTSKFYPLLGANMEASLDCRNNFKLVKSKSSDATDWAQGWYLVYCTEGGSGQGSFATIEVWKVN